MTQANVDPEQLRQFAGSLHRFAQQLRTEGMALASQMNTLEQTWRDQQQRRFADQLQTDLRSVAKIVADAEQHVPYLLRKADQIDAYLGR